MRRIVILALVTAAIGGPALATTPCNPSDPATWPSSVSAVEHNGDTGLIAVPDAPHTLVAFFHGYRNTSRTAWACHIAEAARRGAVAFALDYRGTGWGGPDGTAAASDNRGWFIREGAVDSISLAQQLLTAHPMIETTIAFGISMGANASGYAVAAGATRPGSSAPLFDYWFAIEGAVNVSETYAAATVIAPGNPYAKGATQDIEEECRVASQTLAECLADITLVARADDVAANTGAVVMIHGLADGLVPYDQSVEMAAALRHHGATVEFTTVGTRGNGEAGTTIPSYVLAPAGQAGTDPFAGHGWEGSASHRVITAGFTRLWGLLNGQQVLAGDLLAP